MTGRIRWHEDGALQVWSGFGHAGQAGAQLFTIAAPLPDSDSGYLLMSRLPGMEDFGCSRPRLEDAQAEAERWLEEFVSFLGAVFPEPAAACSDCGADLTVAGLRYCRVDAGRRLADGNPVVYDENPADGESPSVETDCRGSGIYDCPCEADGPDGRCSCCRSGECNGSCVSESPCDFHCGYVGPADQDFWEHVFWEHRASCAECGATKAPGPWQSLTHRLDCPRLQPGYVYPPLDSETPAPVAGEE